MNDKPKIILLQFISIKYTLKLLNSFELRRRYLLILLRQTVTPFPCKIIIASVSFGMSVHGAKEVVTLASEAKKAHFFPALQAYG